ncbi:MAG: S-formylglutathione hydrolase [Turicibacter sp.]|nr:S-formylglutathione hydrolase [Turicibacter sp.]
MSVEILEQHLSFGGTQFKYKHHSAILKSDMTFSLFLPENKDGAGIPLVWFLSGLTCTDDNFTHKSGFQHIANKNNVAVIAPDTSPRGEACANAEAYDLGQGAGFYLNATQSPWDEQFKMYDYITKELTEVVKPLVPNFNGKEAIMGHSMGGHGALVIGMKNPGRFASISAFSPILSPSEVPWGQKAFTAYLGEDKEAWKAWDSTELVKGDDVPPMLIMQGTGDNFYPGQLPENFFLDASAPHGDKVMYQQKAGYDHSYYFIATFMEDHFNFHMKHL